MVPLDCLEQQAIGVWTVPLVVLELPEALDPSEFPAPQEVILKCMQQPPANSEGLIPTSPSSPQD